MTTSARGSLADGVLLAVGTFTVLPVPPPSAVDRARARVAMTVAPLAAVPLGVTVAVVLVLGEAWSWPGSVSGLLAVAALAVGTRVLHLDGLADTVDALSAPYERERRLEIMKRGDVGPAGVVALVLVLGLEAAALGALAGRPYGWLVGAVAVCVARGAVAIVCARGVPAAVPTGLGAAVSGSVPVPVGALVALVSAVVVSLAVAATGAGWPQAWAYGLGAVVAGSLVVVLLVRRAVRVLGGITGDVIGAAIELALVGMLLVLSAA